MVVKEISREDFPENWVERWSNNFMSEEAHELFGKFSNKFVSKGSPIFLTKFDSVFSITNAFVLKTVFSHTWLRHV